MKIRPTLVLIASILTLVAISAAAFLLVRDAQMQTRGVTYLASAQAAQNPPTAIGVNVSLEQYTGADLNRALQLVRDAGFTWVRQHFYWNNIEPRPGEYDWAQWDRIVASAHQYGVRIIAVLDTAPAWARSVSEQDLVTAPPERVEDYARFVAALVQHYGDRIPVLQIWDNPNVHPFWGRRNADAIEYTALLRAAAKAARGNNPHVKILSAGLAPNGEKIRGHPDLSDILYLQGMYDAGARDYFDILGAKPYGMWSGPEDRRVSPDIMNFSRVILLRDEMLSHGDAAKPIWAVEFGWNALPQGWTGATSPWGTDTEQTQGTRLANAIRRARSEWPWMTALVVQTLQPNVPAEDPVWGFALLNPGFQPRPFYAAVSNAIRQTVPLATFDFARLYVVLGALSVVGLIAAWRGTRAALQVNWGEGWRVVEEQFTPLPESAQFALLAVAVIAFYYSPNVILNLALLIPIVLLFALRLDLGLTLTVFAIPFYLLPKTLVGSMQFSLVEILTLASAAGFAIRFLVHKQGNGRRWTQRTTEVILHPSVDFAVLFFVLAGLLSVKIAGNFGVANREFRVIVFEPALLYALVRASRLDRQGLERLVYAFILSAVAISLIGLYQYFFTNYVIIGEGVRRILAVYGSPNNLALYLDRVLPLVLALGLAAGERAWSGRRQGVQQLDPPGLPWRAERSHRIPQTEIASSRSFDSAQDAAPLRMLRAVTNRQTALGATIIYVLLAIPIALCLYLTYSRGAWLLGLPAALFVIAVLSGRRARIAVATLFVIGVVVLIPFLSTERAQSLFQSGTGTGFFRVSVWQSGIAMIRDHPLTGVGLDNFLYEYPKYMQPDAWREPNLSHPHNIVLDFWARMGLPGLVALGWLVFEFYRRGLRGLRTNRVLTVGLLASMSAALAHGMIDAAYFYVDLAFVFMLELAVTAEMGDWVGGRLGD